MGPGTEFGIVMNLSVHLPRYVPKGFKYEVQPGDTLKDISIKFYGTADRFWEIYNANRHILAQPDDLRAGQMLTVPK